MFLSLSFLIQENLLSTYCVSSGSIGAGVQDFLNVLIVQSL
jgi:hypothetical protein